MAISGLAHTCKSPLVACLVTKCFSVRKHIVVSRSPASFTCRRIIPAERRSFVLRAQQGGPEEQQKSPQTEGSKSPGSPGPPLEKGQGTAIVTGAISIIFGVLYLVLVQLLGNLRGNQLEPPPPEAFEQGFLHLFRGLS